MIHQFEVLVYKKEVEEPFRFFYNSKSNRLSKVGKLIKEEIKIKNLFEDSQIKDILVKQWK